MTGDKLQGKGLLAPLQLKFIELFAHLPDQTGFYLTGGTALAEYFLGHRLSFDLDFFTGQEGLVLPMSYSVERNIGDELQLSVVRRFATYVEFLVQDSGDSLKVELALDSPYRFTPPVLNDKDIFVNDYQDIIVDKLLAYYGRAEPRDAVDLYFILQNEPIEILLSQAKEKDPGFDLYWFAVALNKAAGFPDEMDRWPVHMLISVEGVRIKHYLRDLSLKIMDLATGHSN